MLRFYIFASSLLFGSATAQAANQDATRDSLIKQPSFGGTVSREESSVQINGNRGTFVYDIPVSALPSRGDMEAKLSLTYNQLAGSEGTGFGSGWSFQIPSINLGQDDGVPRRGRGKDGEFLNALRVGSEKLIFVGKLESGALRYLPERSTNRVEYLYFDETKEFLYQGKFGQTEAFAISQGWEVRYPDGRREIYSGEEADAEGDFVGSSAFVTRWPLKLQLKKTRGNYSEIILYSYKKSGGYSYLQSISQAGGASEYVFEMSPKDRGLALKTSYRNGFLQVDDQLYTRMRTLYMGEVRNQWCFMHTTRNPLTNGFRYTTHKDCMDYLRAELSSRVNPRTAGIHSELKALYRYGSDPGPVDANTAHEPLMNFEYADHDLSLKDGGNILASRPVSYEIPLDTRDNLDLSEYTIADVNQDSLVDLILDRDGESYYLRGSGDFEESFQDKTLWQVDGEVGAEAGLRPRSGLDHFADINGDSYVDILRFKASHDQQFSLFLGDGRGGYKFAAKNLQIVDPSLGTMNLSDLREGRSILVDLNNDGLTDYLSVQKEVGQKALWLACFGKRGDQVTFKCATSAMPKDLDSDFLGQDRSYRLNDLNGDGLVDLAIFGGRDRYCYYPQTGITDDSIKDRTMPALFGSPDFADAECGEQGRITLVKRSPGSQRELGDLWMLDINGDGIVDFADYNPASKSIDWLAGLGDGNFVQFWRSLPVQQFLNLGDNLSGSASSRIADFDADGQREILLLDQSGSKAYVLDFNRFGEDQLPKAGLLTSIELESGLRYDVMYATSSDEYLRDLKSLSEGEVRSLHFPASVVKRYAISEGRRGNKEMRRAEVHEYIYHRPFYNPDDRTFQGFEGVDEIVYDEQTVLPSNLETLASTHRLILFQREFHSGLNGLEKHLAGQLKSESIHAMRASQELKREQDKSLVIDPRDALLNSLSAYSRQQSLPCTESDQCVLIESSGKIWEAVEREHSGTFFLRQSSSWQRNHVTRSGLKSCAKVDGEESAEDLTVLMRYYSDSNMLREKETRMSSVKGPAAIVLPAQTQLTEYTYEDFPEIGVYDRLKQQNSWSGISGQDLDLVQTITHEYFRDTAWLKSKSQERISRVSQLSKEHEAAFTEQQTINIQLDYDLYGNIKSQKIDGRNPEILEYSDDGTLIVGMKDSALSETRIESDRYGRPWLVTDARGVQTTLLYDSLHRNISTTTNTGLKEERFYRNARDFEPLLIMTRMHVQREKDGATGYFHKLEAYNGRGLEVARFDENEYLDSTGNRQTGVRILDLKTYDRRGQITKIFTPYQTSFASMPELFAQSFTLDADGLAPLESASENKRRSVDYVYDALGRLVFSQNPMGSHKLRSYQLWGTQEQVYYTRQGQIEQRCEATISRFDRIHAKIDALGHAHRFERNSEGDLTAIHLAGEPTPRRLSMNNFGQLEYSEVPGIRTDYLQYDAEGKVISSWSHDKQGKRQHSKTMDYDKAGRLVSMKVDGALSRAFTYDSYTEQDKELVERESGWLNTQGLLTASTAYDANQLYIYRQILVYDEAARVKSRVVSIIDQKNNQEQGPFVETYQYGPDGTMLSKTDAYGVTTRIRLGQSMNMAAAQLSLPWNPGHYESIIEDILYNPKGQVKNISYRNGIQTELDYNDQTLWLEGIRTTAPKAGVLQNLEIIFDGLGNVEQIADHLLHETWGGINRSAAFQYNDRDELIGMQWTKAEEKFGFDPQAKKAYRYAYNPAGVMTFNGEMSEQPLLPDSERDTITGLLPRAAEGQPLRFNELGQLQSNGRVLETRFDGLGQLICARTAHSISFYGYDPEGIRIYKKVTATDSASCHDTADKIEGETKVSLYPMEGIIQEGANRQSFVSTGTYRLARIEHAANDETLGQWFYYLKDHLQSSDVILSEDGTPVEQMVYKPYGAEVNPEAAARWRQHLATTAQGKGPQERTHHRYTGHYLDDDSGLYYMNARYYDVTTAHFVSPDPLYLSEPERCVGNLVACSLYAYAGNNPFTLIDPSGFEERTWSSSLFDLGRGSINGLAESFVPGGDIIHNHLVRQQSDAYRIGRAATTTVVGAWQMVEGAALIGGSISGGGALSATGVGATIGVPIAAAGTVAGAGIMAQGSNNMGHGLNTLGGVAREKLDRMFSTGATGKARQYELNPKHGKSKVGDSSPAPKDPQSSLENALTFKEKSNASRLLSVDKKNQEFVIFDEHRPGVFHGHTRPWQELSQDMKNFFVENGLATPKGKIK